MSEITRCPQCGAELAADAPQGLCPACLFKRGLGTQTTDQSGSNPSADTVVAPTPAELAPHFPELEILQFIGRGGMGLVYQARQKRLGRLVALKILLPNIARDQAFAERFAREARAMAMLSHPNIVAVYDFGQTASLPANAASGFGEGSPLYYFLMEYVDGLTLREVIEAGKLAPPEALAIVPQICEALQYAHDNGVVHRDIKPANILVDKRGQVKIADFGLAKLLGRLPQDLSLTDTGQVMGTPHYMAPEQIERPQEVDQRADIYSVGVVFYQMLTGELPLGRFAPPSKKVVVDVRLDQVVLRALEHEPDRRYQHASQMKTDVESIASTPRAAGEPQGASSGRDWLMWSPFQSPRVREICEHMTASERMSAFLRSGAYGAWVLLTFAGPMGFGVVASLLGVPLGVILAGVVPLVLLHLICIPIWRRRQREFLCWTDWARQQGITPEQLSGPARSLGRGFAVLFFVLLAVVAVAAVPLLWYASLQPSAIGPPRASAARAMPAVTPRTAEIRSSASVVMPPRDQVLVEDLAIQMLAAIRDKDDAALSKLAVDRVPGWREALPQFAMELRERVQQQTGKPLALRPEETLIEDHSARMGGMGGGMPGMGGDDASFFEDRAVVKCSGPKELQGYLVLFFVRTNLEWIKTDQGWVKAHQGWRNWMLRNSPLATPLAHFLKEKPPASKDSGLPKTGARTAADASSRKGEFAVIELQAAKRVWPVDEMPQFQVKVKYAEGSLWVPSIFDGCLLELDGSNWMLRRITPPVAPMASIPDGPSASFTSFRFERDADGRGLHLRLLKDDASLGSFRLEAFDLKTETIQLDRRLTLAPGMHTLRVGARVFTSPSGPAPAVYSNAVTFEIRAARTKDSSP